MASFLPTDEALLSGRKCSDPAVVAAFDRLVLRGQLAPWRPGWWELMGWKPSELERVVDSLRPNP